MDNFGGGGRCGTIGSLIVNVIHTMNSSSNPRPEPRTVEEKLDNMIRRLGRIERDIIDIRTHLHVPRRLSGNMTLVQEDQNF